MNLINSVNIQMAEKHQEILLSFAEPKSNREAMEKAKETIANEGRPVTSLARCARQYGKNVWTAYNGFAALAWITLNEVAVKG